MWKIVSLIPVFIYLMIPLVYSQPVSAAAACQSSGVGAVFNPPQPIPEGSSFTVTFKPVDPGSYQFRVGWGASPIGQTAFSDTVSSSNGSVTLTMNDSHVLDNNTHTGTLLKNGSEFCGDVSYKVGYQFPQCQISFRPPSNQITTNQEFQVDVHHAPMGSYDIFTAIPPSETYTNTLTHITIDANGNGTSPVIPAFTSPQTLSIQMYRLNAVVGEFCGKTTLIVKPIGNGNPVPIPAPGGGGGTGGGDCKNTAGGCSKSAGTPCDPESGGEGGVGGVLTAIGCIPTSPQTLIPKLMGFAAGIGGGIALLLMILGAFQMMTSAGNPEAIKKGRDQFVSAAIGLVFIILSATILRIIGFDILALPGFGK